MRDHPAQTWHPSDLSAIGLRRALVLRDPHLCLSTWAEAPTGAEMEWVSDAEPPRG